MPVRKMRLTTDTTGMDDQLFVSKYLLKLPEQKMLKNFLKQELNQ
jgi:hypothetical protein